MSPIDVLTWLGVSVAVLVVAFVASAVVAGVVASIRGETSRNDDEAGP